MEITLTRLITTSECTFGLLRCGDIVCCTLEDPPQIGGKVYGRTRIPHGTYELDLRKVSPMAERYRDRFGEKHAGMIWLRGVPHFEWVYIHIGNYPKDTDGCILVGNSMTINQNMVGDSTTAYTNLWQRVIPHLVAGGKAEMVIRERDV
jgi:hypothetical protein